MTSEKFACALPIAGALLGLDVAPKTIGLSISDDTRVIALPLETITRTKLLADIEVLQKVIAERKIAGLVLGLPLNMDGSEGPRTQSVRTFASNLKKEISLPILLWDERLSTHEAKEVLASAGLSGRKRDDKLDAVAAAIILQGALDALKALAR